MKEVITSVENSGKTFETELKDKLNKRFNNLQSTTDVITKELTREEVDEIKKNMMEKNKPKPRTIGELDLEKKLYEQRKAFLKQIVESKKED